MKTTSLLPGTPVAALALALSLATAAGETILSDYRWSTLAGRASLGTEDGPPSGARFNRPQKLATDDAGNLFVSDWGNHTVRRIDTSGRVTTLAGTAGRYGFIDATGGDARFLYLGPITTDSLGNVYVADQSSTLRRITPAGAVTTVAGRRDVRGTQDGPALTATFDSVVSLARGPANDLYVLDGERVRRLADGQVATLLLGPYPVTDGNVTYQITHHFDLAAGRGGELYLAVWGRPQPDGATRALVLRRDAAGVLTVTYAGPDVNTWEWVERISTIAVEATGRVVGTVTQPNQPQAAGLVRFDGPTSYTRLAAPVESSGRPATLGGLATAATGEIYYTRTDNVVAGINAVGNLVFSAGTPSGGGDFRNPLSLAIDPAGNVWVADYVYKVLAGRPSTSAALRMVTPAGVVATVISEANLYDVHYGLPAVAATDAAGNAWFIHGVVRTDILSRVSPAGAITQASFLAGVSPMYPVTDCVVDPAGNFLVPEAGSNVVWQRTPDGTWTILAGTDHARGRVDATGAAARFDGPAAICRDASGNCFVLDNAYADGAPQSSYIRRITPTGAVTTINHDCLLDLTPVLGIRAVPTGIAVDSHGNFILAYPAAGFVARLANDVLTPIGGTVGVPGSTDAIGTDARFEAPGRVTIDAADRLFVADGNGTIRLGVPITAAPTIISQPASLTVYAGDTAQFAVTADGWPTPLYEWYCNDVQIPGANTRTLTIANAQATDVGRYWVRIINAVGTVHSVTATLTIAARPAPASAGKGGGGGAPSPGCLLALTLAWLIRHRHAGGRAAT